MIKYSYVYIITNKWNNVLYIGVTSDLIKRVWEHKQKLVKGFTQKYNIDKLVYYEQFENIEEGSKREKQLKGGSRKKKIEYIENTNPTWKDLYEDIL